MDTSTDSAKRDVSRLAQKWCRHLSTVGYSYYILSMTFRITPRRSLRWKVIYPFNSERALTKSNIIYSSFMCAPTGSWIFSPSFTSCQWWMEYQMLTNFFTEKYGTVYWLIVQRPGRQGLRLVEKLMLEFPTELRLPWTPLYMLITKAITWHQ
jgi:hypothetical protein